MLGALDVVDALVVALSDHPTRAIGDRVMLYLSAVGSARRLMVAEDISVGFVEGRYECSRVLLKT